MIANQYIYNWTRRESRRVRFLLGLPHSIDKEKLQQVVEKITEIITQHNEVEQDSVTVAFDSYTANGLDILIQYVTLTSDFKEFILIKEDINYHIMNVLKEENIQVALPSQYLYVKKENESVPKQLSE